MANELNITKEETMENMAETFTGEDKGVMDENKIVPIVNKESPAPADADAESSSISQEGTEASADASDNDSKPENRYHTKVSSYAEDFDDVPDPDGDDRPKKRFFRFRSDSEEESRDKLILSRIKDEDLMEYLALEQRRLEFLQQAKEAKEKRILTAFQLLLSLAAIVAITYLLQDNPTILISILYIVGIVAALNVWKNPHDKRRKH